VFRVQCFTERVLLAGFEDVTPGALRSHVPVVPSGRVLRPGLEVPRVHFLPVFHGSAGKASDPPLLIGVLAPDELGEGRVYFLDQLASLGLCHQPNIVICPLVGLSFVVVFFIVSVSMA
jgi:hypothetical protein